MKIGVECKSPLLQKSLEMFLSKYVSSAKNCDILIKDVKCHDNEKCFYISSASDADLVKPFSKAELMLALENRYKKVQKVTKPQVKESGDSLDFVILEKRIEQLTREYQENIIKSIRAFYER